LAAVSAVTVILNAMPGIAVTGAETVKWVAGVAATVTVPEVPLIEPVTVSVAVTVWPPAVCRVAKKVPVPATNVELAGRVALPSVEVKCTVPA